MTRFAFLFSTLALLATLTPHVAAEELITFKPQKEAHYVAFYVNNVTAPVEIADREAWHELDWKMTNVQFELVRAKNLKTGYETTGPWQPGAGHFNAGPGVFRANCYLKLKKDGNLKSTKFEWRADRSLWNEKSKCLPSEEWDSKPGGSDSTSTGSFAFHGKRRLVEE